MTLFSAVPHPLSSILPPQLLWPARHMHGQRLARQRACADARHLCRRLTIKQLTFVPYGDTVDGSTERLVYRKQLASYLRDSLLPVLASWGGRDARAPAEGELSCAYSSTSIGLRPEFQSVAGQVPEVSCPSCYG